MGELPTAVQAAMDRVLKAQQGAPEAALQQMPPPPGKNPFGSRRTMLVINPMMLANLFTVGCVWAAECVEGAPEGSQLAGVAVLAGGAIALVLEHDSFDLIPHQQPAPLLKPHIVTYSHLAEAIKAAQLPLKTFRCPQCGDEATLPCGAEVTAVRCSDCQVEAVEVVVGEIVTDEAQVTPMPAIGAPA